MLGFIWCVLGACRMNSKACWCVKLFSDEFVRGTTKPYQTFLHICWQVPGDMASLWYAEQKLVSHIRLYFEINNRKLLYLFQGTWQWLDADREKRGAQTQVKRGLNRGRVASWEVASACGRAAPDISHSGLHTTSKSDAHLIRVLTCCQLPNHEDKRMDLPSFAVCCGHHAGCR